MVNFKGASFVKDVWSASDQAGFLNWGFEVGEIVSSFDTAKLTISSPETLSFLMVKDFAYQARLYQKYFPTSGAMNWLDDFIAQPSGVADVKRDEEVIISLTSYPARMQTTWLAIESLLRQEEKPDRVVLNLFEGEFPGRVVPWFIRQQMKRGLEINWCPENLKVFLKVIPAIQKFPEAAVVAVDDDIIYPSDRLKNLIAGYREHPDCVIAQEVREIAHHAGVVYPCCEWNFTGWNGFIDERKLGPSNILVPEGVTGVLFPPNSLAQIVQNYTLFKELTPTEDDLWLYSALLLNRKNVVKIESFNLPFDSVILDAHYMDSALSKINTANNYRVSTQSFYNLFEKLKLNKILNMTDFCRDSEEARVTNYRNLGYGEFYTPRQLKSPIALLEGFSWTENWVSQRGGVWTDKEMAKFSLISPEKGFVKIQFKARFLKHPIHDFIKFRIKRNGATVFRGEEYETDFFNFMMIDYFEKFNQTYELIVDNPIVASTCGFTDERNLGILIHKVNLEPYLQEHCDANFVETLQRQKRPLNINFINIDQNYLPIDAGIISFDYANDQCGLNALNLQEKFHALIMRSHSIAQNNVAIRNRAIPFFHLRSWHTSTTNPNEIPDYILDKYISSLKIMRVHQKSWRHMFWCNNKKLIPLSIERLMVECPFLEIHEVENFPGTFVGKEIYERLMSDNRYTNANDIFRMSLIHAIGGYYMDLGFEINEDISTWANSYNYIFHMYDFGAIDHNFMAMPPHNKITGSYLRRLLNPEGISKTFKDKWKHDPYFQQHLFCGSIGLMIDLLDSTNEQDDVLFVPEKNSYYRRYHMNSWGRNNILGNKSLTETKVDLFNTNK
ncbi:MAG: hypothetical protein V4544_05450 [Pseudomonadota bacterium]